MKIRIEAGALTRKEITGVGYYTRGITTALSSLPGAHVDAFTLNNSPIKHLRPSETLSLSYPRSLPLRVYRKLAQFYLAPPFDSSLDPVDVTLFPDFAVWPTQKSGLRGVVIHDLTFMEYPDFLAKRKVLGIRLPVTYWYLSQIVGYSVRHADFIVTVSSSVKNELVETYGLNPDSIIVTPIPPHDEFLSQANNLLTKSFILDTYKIKTPHYILCVGTIEPRKNHLATLHAYLKLPLDLRQKYSLVFAGSVGWSSDETIKEIKHAQTQGENIVITGYFDMSHSYALYHHASLFTSASHYEGFGMPLMESIAAQTPMVLSDIPIYREVADDAALYIHVDNPEAYADAIAATLTDRQLRKKLIAKGEARLSAYSWKMNAQLIVSHCKKLFSTSKRK